VSKARDLEAQLEEAQKRHHLYRRITRQMTRVVPLGESLAAIVGHVADYLEADSCLAYLHDGDDLVLVAARDPRPETLGTVRIHPSEGLTGWVARERRMLSISREAYSDPRFKHFSSLPEDTYEAFLSAPVTARGLSLGVINVQHRAPHNHTGDQMEVITTVGELLGCLVLLSQADGVLEGRRNYAELALRAIPVVQ
jgi:two-component system, response regulator PdtaR